MLPEMRGTIRGMRNLFGLRLFPVWSHLRRRKGARVMDLTVAPGFMGVIDWYLREWERKHIRVLRVKITEDQYMQAFGFVPHQGMFVQFMGIPIVVKR